MKTLLKNGKIYDGTGAEPFVGDVLVEDERIAAVGSGLQDEADEVIDLAGLSISPGFIDAHSHNDWFAIKKEPLKSFGIRRVFINGHQVLCDGVLDTEALKTTGQAMRAAAGA